MTKLTLEVDMKDASEIRSALAILQTALGTFETPAPDGQDQEDDEPQPADIEWTRFFDNLWPRLGSNARELLKAQAEFPEGDYWPSEDLASRLAVTVAQLTGRRANLGRSVKATADELGVDADDYELAEYEWDEDSNDRWLYRLPRGAHRAIAKR